MKQFPSIYLLTILLLGPTVMVGCGGPAVEPMKVTNKTPESSFVDQMVAKAHGDVNALSPEEKKKMDSITRGHTEMVLKAGSAPSK